MAYMKESPFCIITVNMDIVRCYYIALCNSVEPYFVLESGQKFECNKTRIGKS